MGRYIIGGSGGLFVYYLVLFGLLLGASVGYDAPSANEAVMEYNETHLIAGDEVVETELNWSDREENPEEYQSEFEQSMMNYTDPVLDPMNNATASIIDENRTAQITRSYAESQYNFAFSTVAYIGDWSAGFFYRNQWWLPSWLVTGVLQLAAVLPPLGFVVGLSWRWREKR